MSKGYFEQKRHKILDAAFVVCMKKPMHEVSMRDVISESGLSQGGIYRYFSNLDEILIELINWKMVLATGALQLLIFIVSVSIVSFTKGVSLPDLLNLSLQTIVMGVIMTFIQGATGEESGWRGFLQPSVEKNFSVIKASLIVGVIWGFWHTPLWILSSGYSGIKLVQYIFVIC